MGSTPTDRRTGHLALDRFARERQILLTTYRRDGTPVGTPVHAAVNGDVAYIGTFDPSGKLKRMRRNTEAEVEPSTRRGRPTGPALKARARAMSQQLIESCDAC